MEERDMSDIRADDLVVRDPDMIAAEMDGDLVMMSIEQGRYYGIGGVGTRVWELLEKPASVDQLCSAVLDEYDVEEDVCRSDIQAYVERLLDMGLLQHA
jgi:hypothetical protein